MDECITVGELLKFISKHNIDIDTKIMFGCCTAKDITAWPMFDPMLDKHGNIIILCYKVEMMGGDNDKS